ncbi:MAG: ABC transporter substrate-binding protein [Bacteroidetes bacterium]|nr:MAG: ABC transporter substrate-binding protein [Bacteroidota bacterium]PTM11081.1 MAG: ABC transporter substrate-binding protein [Bacteroidota bacterium]
MSATTRRNIFKALALGTISLPIALRLLTGESQAQQGGGSPTLASGERYEWKMTTTWPPNFPVLDEACKMFARLINEMSAGRIKITVYGGGELAPPLKAFETVRTGGAELGSGAGYYWAGIAPAAQFFATVPFGMNAAQHTGWIMNGGGLELWQELYDQYNLVPFLGGNTGVQMGGWFNREINSIKDIQGLKMRIPGLGGTVFNAAGGAQVTMAGSELYTNLERGVIDATEWLGPYHDTLMGFNEIAKYYYTPGWHEPGTALEFFINKEKYNLLSPDLKVIMRSASYHTHLWCWMEMEKRNAEALNVLVEKGIQLRQFPQSVLAEFRRLTHQVIQDLVDSDPFSAKVYASFQAYQRQAFNYAAITEKRFYDDLQVE